MSRYQTSALTGMMLDFACAQFDSHCEDLSWEFRGDHYVGTFSEDGGETTVITIITDVRFIRMLEICREYKLQHQLVYSPSTNWARGGPIIESENIDLCAATITEPRWTAGLLARVPVAIYGGTPLIAAMRAFVASKAGDSIELAGAV